jgi:hypothetical protein
LCFDNFICTVIKTGNPLLLQGAVSDQVETTSCEEVSSDWLSNRQLVYKVLGYSIRIELLDHRYACSAIAC